MYIWQELSGTYINSSLHYTAYNQLSPLETGNSPKDEQKYKKATRTKICVKDKYVYF